MTEGMRILEARLQLAFPVGHFVNFDSRADGVATADSGVAVVLLGVHASWDMDEDMPQ